MAGYTDIYGTTVAVYPRIVAERLYTVSGQAAVEAQILHLISTVRGEYPMNPSFGLPASVFSAGSKLPYYEAQIADSILANIWAIERVEVSSEWLDTNGTELGVSIKYWVRGALQPTTLTKPFWRLQEEYVMSP
jgi:hypothetical protein